MNYLIFSDIHIEKKSLEECKIILNEILDLCLKNNITKVISLGDNFDGLYPEPECQDLLADFIKKINREFIVIIADSHESQSKTISELNHYSILNENVKTYKEYIEDNIFFGHFAVKESKKGFGSKVSTKDLKQYRKVFLGHVHTFEKFDEIYQLGSTRFVNFDEKDDKKVVAILNNFGTQEETTNFIELKTPYKMKQFDIDGNLKEVLKELDNLDGKTKVKIRIFRFEDFKNYINKEKEYEQKFIKYIRENKFITNEIKEKKETNTKKIKDVFMDYLSKNNISDGVSFILKEACE
jgi:DNA repair exonuclease SbcCD nuclease subunit